MLLRGTDVIHYRNVKPTPRAPVERRTLPYARPYTAEDDEAIRAGALRGDSARIVGDRIGRTRNSIISHAGRLGVRFDGRRN